MRTKQQERAVRYVAEAVRDVGEFVETIGTALFYCGRANDSLFVALHRADGDLHAIEGHLKEAHDVLFKPSQHIEATKPPELLDTLSVANRLRWLLRCARKLNNQLGLTLCYFGYDTFDGFPGCQGAFGSAQEYLHEIADTLLEAHQAYHAGILYRDTDLPQHQLERSTSAQVLTSSTRQLAQERQLMHAALRDLHDELDACVGRPGSEQVLGARVHLSLRNADRLLNSISLNGPSNCF